jgi:hypothetical protein
MREKGAVLQSFSYPQDFLCQTTKKLPEGERKG